MGNRFVKAGVAGAVGALAGVAAWFLPEMKRRRAPAERERRRRLAVHAYGRLGSATIVDFRDGLVTYTYWVGGVEHLASQDLSLLGQFLPPDPATLIELPASIKYLARNPANSIVLCEEWSGLRFRARVSVPAGQVEAQP
jgi:hypothetical protein